MKVTASQMAKNPDMVAKGLSVYVVKEAEGLRPANRKDHAKRTYAVVQEAATVEGARLCKIVTDMGSLFVSSSQWFDVVEKTPVDTDVPAIEAPATPDEAPAVEYPDTTQDELRAARAERDAALAGSETLARQLNILEKRLMQLQVESRHADDEGYSLVADQVGTMHAMIPGQDVMCETETRTLTVIATNVHGDMLPGRKVCTKCAKIVRDPDSQNDNVR